MFLLIQFIYSHFAPTPAKRRFHLVFDVKFFPLGLFTFSVRIFYQSFTEVKDLTPNIPTTLPLYTILIKKFFTLRGFYLAFSDANCRS